MTELDKEDENCNLQKPESKKLNKIVSILRQLLGLKLFGIDVIIENETNRYLIIDLNIFPGNFDVLKATKFFIFIFIFYAKVTTGYQTWLN